MSVTGVASYWRIDMKKSELVAAVAKKTGLSQKDTDSTIKALTEVIGKELKKGGKVQLVGFGKKSCQKGT